MLKDASVMQTKFIGFLPIQTDLHLFDSLRTDAVLDPAAACLFLLMEAGLRPGSRLVPYGKSGTMVS